MISLDDYFGRHTLTEFPSPEVKQNAIDLLSRVNAVLSVIDLEEARAPKVNSGWRPAKYNASVPGAALRSKHITGQAVDIGDPEGALDEFLFENQPLLAQHGLYMEHPLATKGWCHLQCVAPRSGNRVFYP